MKFNLIFYFVLGAIIACSNNKIAKDKTSSKSGSELQVASNTETNQTSENGIVGEWQQEFTSYDKNNNYKFDPEERTPGNTKLGFDWFRFNADGTCLRDKDIKFKGTYKIVEERGKKRLMITGGDDIKFSIESLTAQELVLGKDGVFIVFKRIN